VQRRHDKPFPYVVAWAVATLAAFAGTGRLGVARPEPVTNVGASHATTVGQPDPVPIARHGGAR
jgi:hypothetical protein